jgi:hypothetical protein
LKSNHERREFFTSPYPAQVVPRDIDRQGASDVDVGGELPLTARIFEA